MRTSASIAIRVLVLIPLTGFMAAGCSEKVDTSVTLYRNSPIGLSDRVQFASFDSNETMDFNNANCAMAARLLNANVAAAAKSEGKSPPAGAGFWCERGRYKADGPVPLVFETSFPAKSDNALTW